MIGLVTVGPAENNSDENLDRSARIRTWSLSHTVVWQGLVLTSAVQSSYLIHKSKISLLAFDGDAQGYHLKAM